MQLFQIRSNPMQPGNDTGTIVVHLSIYKAAAATIKAPKAPTNEPDKMLAALVAAVDGPVAVAEPVGLALVAKVAFPLDPEDLVAVAVDAAPVTMAVSFEPDPPMPVGERPEPELTIAPPVAAVERDEAALANEDAVVAVPDPEPVAEDLAELLLLLPEETPEQERSKRGLVLRGVPGAIPNEGLGVALLSVSSRVYHQVLTTPKLGHPT
jgi:hypothetical protein